MTRRVAVLFLVASGLLALPAAADGKWARCKAKGSETVASNSLVRVFSRPERDGEGTEVVGCWRATGRKTLIAYEYDDGYVTSIGYRDLRLRGRFVALVAEATDVSCKAACPPDYDASRTSVGVVDVRTRRVRESSSDATLGSLKLTRAGVAAWLAPAAGGSVELLATDGAGVGRVIDSGAIEAVGLRGLRLGWRNAGQPRGVDLQRI
jgi:hypothetical protein